MVFKASRVGQCAIKVATHSRKVRIIRVTNFGRKSAIESYRESHRESATEGAIEREPDREPERECVIESDIERENQRECHRHRECQRERRDVWMWVCTHTETRGSDRASFHFCFIPLRQGLSLNLRPSNKPQQSSCLCPHQYSHSHVQFLFFFFLTWVLGSKLSFS